MKETYEALKIEVIEFDTKGVDTDTAITSNANDSLIADEA